MKSFLFLFVMAFSSAQAHFSLGIYEGVTDEGASCQVNLARKSFTDNIRHPLNENIATGIIYGGINYEFSLKHPPLFNLQTGEISYDHNRLEQTKAANEGALGLSVEMKYSDRKSENKKDGPQSFILSYSNWKNSSLSWKLVCKELAYKVVPVII